MGQNIVVKDTSTQPTSKAKSQLSQAKNSTTTIYQPSKAGNSASTGGRKRKVGIKYAILSSLRSRNGLNEIKSFIMLAVLRRSV